MKPDDVLHGMWSRLQGMGGVHTSLSVSPSLSGLAKNTEEEKNIRLLEWWKAPDHFDMLIRSFQTAGICTCNNSNFAFF